MAASEAPSDEHVGRLMAATGADAQQARFLLEAAGGNFDAAASMYYGGLLLMLVSCVLCCVVCDDETCAAFFSLARVLFCMLWMISRILLAAYTD